MHWGSPTLPLPQIDRVVLMRPSSVTHTNNMEQRLLQLQVSSAADQELTVLSPLNPTYAPPGFYLVVLISGDGVPSHGEWLRLAPG